MIGELSSDKVKNVLHQFFTAVQVIRRKEILIFPTSKKEIFIRMGIFAFQPELGHERFPVTSDKVCFIIRYFPFLIQHLLSYKQISVMKIVLIQCPVSANEILNLS